MPSKPQQRRRFLPIILLLLIAGAVWATLTYPKVGLLAFNAGAALEAKIYGFSKQAVDIGELELVTYQGGPDTADAIIMVHGYTADKDVWPRFAKHFVDDYRVIIPDLAGHGETVFNPEFDHGIPAQTARLVKLMDTLGIAKAHIIGNSMGGHIAGYFAIHYPERCLSTAPLDPAGVTSPTPSQSDLLRAQGENRFFVASREDFDKLYPMTMAQAPWLPGFMLDGLAAQYISRLDVHKQIWTAIDNSPHLTTQLPQLAAPALLVWGDQDQLLHVSATQPWAAGVPHIQVEIMPGIGHMPMVEAPEALAVRYHQFLAEI